METIARASVARMVGIDITVSVNDVRAANGTVKAVVLTTVSRSARCGIATTESVATEGIGTAFGNKATN
jgi:hypothetical protein